MTKIPLGISKYPNISISCKSHISSNYETIAIGITEIGQAKLKLLKKWYHVQNRLFHTGRVEFALGCTRGVWIPHGACGFHTGRVEFALGSTRGVWNKL